MPAAPCLGSDLSVDKALSDQCPLRRWLETPRVSRVAGGYIRRSVTFCTGW